MDYSKLELFSAVKKKSDLSRAKKEEFIEGFPDSFSFPRNVGDKNTYKQCGNTVCVPVVSLIAKEIYLSYWPTANEKEKLSCQYKR